MKRLEPGPTRGRYEPDENNDLQVENTPKPTIDMSANEVVVTDESRNTSKGREVKFNPREKPGLKKFAEKKMNYDRNTLAEQKLKKNDSKMSSTNSGEILKSSCGVIVFTLVNICLLFNM